MDVNRSNSRSTVEEERLKEFEDGEGYSLFEPFVLVDGLCLGVLQISDPFFPSPSLMCLVT